jgi:hypothetical protein
MNSQTDASGHTNYYEYDGLNRLRLIRDQNSNIVKQLDYNLRTYSTAVAVWQSDGQLQCKPCPANALYITNLQQHHEVDVNPLSATYNQGRWVDDAVPGNCVIVPDWQIFSTSCQQGGTGNNNGFLNTVLKDNNPCSPTYNQTQLVISVNTTACPVPTIIAVVGSNSLNATFQISLTNTTTGLQYLGNISYSILTGDITINNVPSGTYNVTISPLNGYSTAYSFQIGNYAMTGSGVLAVNGITINTNLDGYILIDAIGTIR